jgi:peroxiredoxin
MVNLSDRTKCWLRYAIVTVLSFPLALGIRFCLQTLLAEDLATGARAIVRQEKGLPLSEPLEKILSDSNFKPHSTQAHRLLSQTAPDFTLADDQLNQVSLSRLCRNGPVVLVFYYGYFCPHCVSQLFALNDDIKLFKELGVQVIAVSADSPEVTTQRFQEFGRFGFSVLSDPGNQVAQQYGVYQPASAGRPESLVHATFLIGTDGRIFWANLGEQPFFDNKTLLVEMARHQGIARSQ